MLVDTRDFTRRETVSGAILRGIAPDGGLYLPVDFSKKQIELSSMLGLSYPETAKKVLAPLLEDFTEQEISDCVDAAYTRFDDERIAPLVKVGDHYVLELFHGPTKAFKDFALQLLPHLITTAKRKNGKTENLLILTATSGDTGKAALEGFRDVPGTGVIVFYPEDGVSDVQKAQMVTQEGSNVRVCAIKGNFDDAQTGVKTLFADEELVSELKARGYVFSSANSINFGRLAPQVAYYFHAYATLAEAGALRVGDPVDFTVPTGNFGDILAGYLAFRMGLPIRRLFCASNGNNVLTDFLTTGTYDRRRTFYKTASPSMDILVSSNLERLFPLMNASDKETAGYLRLLSENGFYTVSDELKRKISEKFGAGFADDEKTFATIKRVFEKERYLMDTHTAVAYAVAEENDHAGVPSVVLSTASPYKFSSAIQPLFREKASDEWAGMESLREATGVPIPKELAGLRDKKVLHTASVGREEMKAFVLSVL